MFSEGSQKPSLSERVASGASKQRLWLKQPIASIITSSVPSSKEVLLELLQVIKEQHTGEEKESAKVVAATSATSTTTPAFAQTEWREPTTSIIKFWPLDFPFLITLNSCT